MSSSIAVLPLRLKSTEGLEQGLIKRIGERKFEMWFRDGVRCTLTEGHLRVDACNSFVADWIARHYANELRDCAAEISVDGSAIEVEIVASPALFAGASILSKGTATTNPSNTLDSRDPCVEVKSPKRTPRPPATRLEDFEVSPSNALALHAARSVGMSDANAPPMTFLYGGCGTGKSHLLQAIVHERLRARDGGRVRSMTAEKFTNEYLTAMRMGGLDGFRTRVRHNDLLVIDDVQFFANKPATQSEFLFTLDALLHAGAKVVVAADAHPSSQNRFSPPLTNRFIAGVVVEVGSADFELRRKLAIRFAGSRALVLPPTAVDLVADRCLGGAREITGAVSQLLAMRSLDPHIDLVIAAEAALGGSSRLGPVRIDIDSIIHTACDAFGVTPLDVRGSSRRRDVVDTRGVVAMLARELTQLSLPEIARGMGRTAHSTVLQAARRMRSRCDSRGSVACSDGLRDARVVLDQMRIALTRPTVSPRPKSRVG
ncbi:MAG: DnaA/Hda family protein [Planctomycetota bacterium]|nr:DnaA/Hda family protein [Planctomycetota bacterium]